MTDYGHPITFGLSLYPSVDQLGETRQLAQAADAAGIEVFARDVVPVVREHVAERRGQP